MGKDNKSKSPSDDGESLIQRTSSTYKGVNARSTDRNRERFLSEYESNNKDNGKTA